MSAAAPPVNECTDDQSAAACPTLSLDRAVTGGEERTEQAAALAAESALLTPLTQWSTLYSDALHSIFKFASLQDLTRLMSVSRRWSEAVMTTPPLAVPATIVSEAHLVRVLSSHARRHITSLWQRGSYGARSRYEVSIVQLPSISAQTPWLTELNVKLPVHVSLIEQVETVRLALSRFNKLRELALDLSGQSDPADVSACNRVITTVSKLSSAMLSKLELHVPSAAEISFAPLSALSQLRTLTFGFRPGDEVTLTDAQIRELRSLTSVQQLSTPYGRRSQADFLVRMLQPGHALQWTSLGSALVSDPLAAVLGSLPTLTAIKAELQCADLRFFSQLRSLSDVELTEGVAAVDPTELVRSLRHCSQISRLTLRMFDLTCAQLEHLLSAFPLLCSLTLARLPLLESLRCLSTPVLAASLQRLELRNLPRCPPSDISHLFGLRSLRLIIIDSLSAALSASQKAEFAVPSNRFPMLKAALCLGLHSIARV